LAAQRAAEHVHTSGLVPLDPDVIRMAHCDAQHIGAMTDPSSPANDLEPDESRGDHADTSDRARSAPDTPVGASTRGRAPLEHQNAHVSAAIPQRADDEAVEALAVGPDTARSSAGPAVPRLACASPGVPGKHPSRPAPRGAAARPASMPGAGLHQQALLDVHHIQPRSEGRRHSLENLTCLSPIVVGAHDEAAKDTGLSVFSVLPYVK